MCLDKCVKAVEDRKQFYVILFFLHETSGHFKTGDDYCLVLEKREI